VLGATLNHQLQIWFNQPPAGVNVVESGDVNHQWGCELVGAFVHLFNV